MGFIKEFKEFAMRGNVMDMAVGIIIGTAFGKIVSSMVGDMIMPIVGAVSGGKTFDEYTVTIADAQIKWGKFVQTVVDFLIVALVIFIMIKIMNSATERMRGPKEEAKPATPEDILLLREIRDNLKK